MNIFVASLSYNTKVDTLRRAFEEYGEVSSAKIVTDRDTGKSKGFGFVEMPDDQAGQSAIDALNQSSLDGRNIVVKVALPKA
ncbi:MAG: RNA-binding protein [Flavobacteriales bacterium]|nr:RNA-binding protein [Flavobacteriales bacterium]